LYYTDFGYEGTARFGDAVFKVGFAGSPSKESYIWIDRNGNGKSEGRAENYGVGKPLNIGGATYELKPMKNTFEVVVSAQKVDEIPLPPDLSVGQVAPKFAMKATDGTLVSFPDTYKGKVVLMDFWATWCGPCIAELPNVKKAYAKYHAKGFDVLGISLDQANAGDKLASFTKENDMPWKQLFEGKYWDITIGKQYGVEAIPFVLLVDGDTGKILATAATLRGEALDKTLEKIFASRG
jgi:peroxiredoxin